MTKSHTTDFSLLPPIMAIDFDGTLVENKFPEIGEARVDMCTMVKSLREQGVKIILWTSRNGYYLQTALDWCKEHDLHFDAVNENIPEVKRLTGEDTRKVYADLYVDDKSCDDDLLDINIKMWRKTNWHEKLASLTK